MVTILFIIGISCAITLSVYLMAMKDISPFDKVAATLFSNFLFYLCGVGTYLMVCDREPTAMDVYSGKTALEVTYRDSIPVDTVVVFKDKQVNQTNKHGWN